MLGSGGIGGGFGASGSIGSRLRLLRGGLHLEARSHAPIHENHITLTRNRVRSLYEKPVDEYGTGGDALGGVLLPEELDCHVGGTICRPGTECHNEGDSQQHPFQHFTASSSCADAEKRALK